MYPGRTGAGRDGVQDAGMLSCPSSASAALPPCRSSEAAAPALCKQGGSLPARGQAAKFQPRAHFYSMTAVRPGAGCRREGCGTGSAMRGWFTQHCLPRRFPLPVWGKHARYYKTSFFLSLRVRRGPLTPPGPPHPVHPLPSFVLLFQAVIF